MRKIPMKKKIILLTLTLTLILALSLASCNQADVVGKSSIMSFNEVLKFAPDSIKADDTFGGWSLTSPDGTARFMWSKDFSKSATYDAMLEFDAKPFLDAGLDITKLPAGMVKNDKLVVGNEFGNEKITYSGDATPLTSYEKIVELKRSNIKYHADLDHFGIDLSGGNVFEWAKDMAKNDKDIVFVLNPKVFIDAGVDPAKVEGWAFKKVNVEDENGKPIQVDKFLKPFDLKK
jgi:hypothetical protein